MDPAIDAPRLRGFRGPVAGFAELIPAIGPVWEVGRSSPQPGPAPRAAVLRALTETLGPLEEWLPRVRDSLVDGGVLVADIGDLHSPDHLAELLEPSASTALAAPPPLRVDAGRLLAACDAAGLVVRELVPVPAARALPAGLGDALAGLGYDAARWIGPAPPDRRWLVAERGPARAGSVIAAPATLDRLAASLPPDFEPVPVATGIDGAWTPAALDRAIAAARGELLWFVPPGSPADARELAAARDLHRDRPLRAAGTTDGLDGLLLARRDALLAGPIALHLDETDLAVADWLLRLERIGRSVAGFASPVQRPAVAAPLRASAAARRRFAELWQPAGREAAPPAARGAPTSPARTLAAPRLALCMIVRDEQRFLDDCLARAATWVDEIVVVDTGSTDDTVAIAAHRGARVLHAAWGDDFAAARNVGLAATDADWILVLDADERVDPADAPRVRRAIASPRHAGYALRMCCRVGDGGAPTRDASMLRLFRRLPGVRFEGRIHEQVWPTLLAAAAPRGLTVTGLDVAIDHHGYLPDVWRDRAKDARNERLFRLQLDETPDDPYHLFKYGEFLARDPARQPESRAHLQRAAAAIDRQPPSIRAASPYAPTAFALLASHLGRGGDLDGAAELVTRALRDLRPSPDLHFVAAELAAARGDRVRALLHLEACRSFADRLLAAPPAAGVTSWRALALAAEIHARHRDPSRAAIALDRARRAAREAPDDADETLALATSRVALARGDAATALTALTELLRRRPDSAAGIQACATLLERLGDPERARRLRDAAP